MNEHLSQKERLDALFRSRPDNEKIPLYELCSSCHMAAYSRRIEELRADYDALTVAGVEDYLIVNYLERRDGVTHSWYAREPRSGRPRWQPRHRKPVQVTVRLQAEDTPWERERPRTPRPLPANPLPLKSWEQVCAERDAKMAEPEPEWSLTP